MEQQMTGRRLGAAALVIAAAGFAHGIARADIVPITYTIEVPFEEFRTNVTGGQQGPLNFIVPQQNLYPGLELISAQIEVTQQVRSSLQIIPVGSATITASSGLMENGQPVFPRVTTQATGTAASLGFLDTGGTTLLQNPDGSIVTLVWNGSQGAYTTVPGLADLDPDPDGWLVLRSQTFTSSVFTDPDQLALFELGASDLIFEVTGEGRSFFRTSTGSGGAIFQTFAGASLRVTYTLVPEPAGLATLGLGSLIVAGFTLVRTRRRSAA